MNKNVKLECLDENGDWVEVGKILDFSNKEKAISEPPKVIGASCSGRIFGKSVPLQRPEWRSVPGHGPEGRKSDRKRNRKNRWR